MVKIRQNLVSKEKYGLKCPYTMTPKFVVVHNTENDASADNEIKYMISNNHAVSFHYAVDDKEIVQGVLTNRNAWHAGDGANGQGNRFGIGIEICYSKSGGHRYINAEKLAVKLIAQILKEHGWGIDKIKKHQDFSGKYCPRRLLDMGWQRFLNMVQAELNPTSTSKPTTSTSKPITSSSTSKPTNANKKPDQILTVGSVVTSKPMGIKAGIKKIDGVDCVNVPSLGGFFPLKYLDEYDASDGKLDQIISNDKAKVVVAKTTVQKVDNKKKLVMIYGIWVKTTSLVEVKNGK